MNQEIILPSMIRQKKKIYVALTRPKSENWVGRSIFFFFFFFYVPWESWVFQIFCKRFLNGENSGGMQSKRIYKCFFKPLNKKISKFFAQIWHFQKKKKKKKKKNDPVFFAFYGRSGEGNITIFLFFFWGGGLIRLQKVRFLFIKCKTDHHCTKYINFSLISWTYDIKTYPYMIGLHTGILFPWQLTIAAFGITLDHSI